MQSDSPINHQALRIKIHLVIHLFIHQTENDCLISYHCLVMAFCITYCFLITSLARKLPIHISHIPILILLLFNPFYQFQNLFDDTVYWKLKYNLYKKKKYHAVEVVDWLEYNFVFHKKLLDNYKTTKEIDISNYGIKVLTDVGYQPISCIYNTKPFAIYKVILENGYSIECADKHMLFDENFNIIYADELVENLSRIMTDKGPSVVKSVS